MTETGRAMTAHHALMVVNVSEVERAPDGAVPRKESNEPAVLRHLREAYIALDKRPILELFLDAQQALAEGQNAYVLGQLTLAQRAQLDDLFYAVAHGVRARLTSEKSHRAALVISTSAWRQILREFPVSSRSPTCGHRSSFRSCRSRVCTRRPSGAA